MYRSDILNLNVQHYKGIPLTLVNKDYTGFSDKMFLIGNSTQLVWIPIVFLEDDGTIKSHANLDYIFKSRQGRNKLMLASINN